MTGAPARVVFVCLGNICRSPLARVIFESLAASRGVQGRFPADSCGTGSWHAGGPADPRSVRAAAARGISLRHTARVVDPVRDFAPGAMLLAMDRSNRAKLLRLGAPADRLHLLRAFDPDLAGRPDHELDVPDPYDMDDAAFARVADMAHRACAGLLDSLLRDHRA